MTCPDCGYTEDHSHICPRRDECEHGWPATDGRCSAECLAEGEADYDDMRASRLPEETQDDA